MPDLRCSDSSLKKKELFRLGSTFLEFGQFELLLLWVIGVIGCRNVPCRLSVPPSEGPGDPMLSCRMSTCRCGGLKILSITELGLGACGNCYGVC
jgi:hypothetical protein